MPKKSVNLSADAIEKVEAFEKADSRGSFSNALETIIHRQIPDKKKGPRETVEVSTTKGHISIKS